VDPDVLLKSGRPTVRLRLGRVPGMPAACPLVRCTAELRRIGSRRRLRRRWPGVSTALSLGGPRGARRAAPHQLARLIRRIRTQAGARPGRSLPDGTGSLRTAGHLVMKPALNYPATLGSQGPSSVMPRARRSAARLRAERCVSGWSSPSTRRRRVRVSWSRSRAA
jgi:hypothetical protein